MQPIRFTRPDGREVEYQPWSDAQLSEMATATEEDQRRAERYWRSHLPRPLVRLLDAVSRVALNAIHLE